MDLDEFSKPLEIVKTRLATIYSLNPRDSKIGRLFIPVYDERHPLNFMVRYAYISKFLKEDNASGNHYHKIKEEMLIPIDGKFEIHLQDATTNEKDIINMDPNENQAIFIQTGIAHKIVSKEDKGVVLVLASASSAEDDEI